MSFHAAQTFTFGEQPSATKWQYIWDNDYALADGSGISSGAIVARHFGAGEVGNAALASGVPVQVKATPFTSVATGSTTTPIDDTNPQITEGTEFMTIAFTPKSSTNRLLIEAVASAATTGVNFLTIALHQDSVANALAAVPIQIDAANTTHPAPLVHDMLAGTTSSITFRIRIGPNSADTVTFNGRAGARLYGAITKSLIKVTEYKP